MENSIREVIIKRIQFKAYPKTSVGGQVVGITGHGVTLYSEETNFKISINQFRSQIRNKEMALLLFELYLDEILR
jgi:protein subunit release factor A